MGRVVRFNDERDFCFNCQRSPETCDDGRSLCTYIEATKGNPNIRSKLDLTSRIQSCGVAEVPLFPLNFGMTELAERVLAYSEPWMRLSDWSLTNG